MQGPSGQFAERAGSGLHACSSRKELRFVYVRRSACKHLPFPVACCEGFLNLNLASLLKQCDETQRIEVK